MTCNWLQRLTQSEFLFINWKMKIRTCPDFKFLFEKKKIRTCPDFYLSIEYFKSGLVQIWNFWLKISNPDLSRFELQTRPNFFFSIENLKSGLVQISILDFRFYPHFFLQIYESEIFFIHFYELRSFSSQVETQYTLFWTLCRQWQLS